MRPGGENLLVGNGKYDVAAGDSCECGGTQGVLRRDAGCEANRGVIPLAKVSCGE